MVTLRYVFLLVAISVLGQAWSSAALAQAPRHLDVAIPKEEPQVVAVVDSATWTDAWIEVIGRDTWAPKLRVRDIRVTNDGDTAKIISIDSIGSKFSSRLAVSFVLDNSASMFHSYDSLTRDLDSLIAGLPAGARGQAIVFDNEPRSASHRYTGRSNVYLATSGRMDSLARLPAFWHYYDSVRVAFTPFFDAIVLALEQVEAPSEDVLIGVTDGEDNASEVSIETLAKLFKGSGVRPYFITYRSPSRRLQWLARQTGGSWYHADDLEDLRNLLHELGLSLTRSYHVRYQFPSLTPSSPRRH